MEHRKLCEIAEIKFCANSPGRAKTQSEQLALCAAPSNFFKNNSISNNFSQFNYAGENYLEIKSGDIVVKRIEPTFINYIDEIPQNVYAGNNLIIITARQGLYPKYLAMILNEKIATLSNTSSIGAVIKSIGRSELDNLKVPLIDYSKQIFLGNLWYESIELEKLKVRLDECEHIKSNILIQQYIKSRGGENNG